MAHENAGDQKIKSDRDYIIGGHHSFEAKDFFGDKKGNTHRLGCTCVTLIILFIVVFVVLMAGVYLAGQPSILPEENQEQSTAVQPSISAQLEDALRSKNDKTTLILTEKELGSYMPASSRLVIMSEGVYTVGSFLGFSAVIKIEPYIAEGQLRFKIESVKVGSLPIPSFLSGSIVGDTAELMRKLTSALSVMNIESIEVKDEGILLTGQIVGR